MIDFLSLVLGVTRAWTTTYTLGLAADLKEGRRDEIESDLWDQQRLAHLQGEPPLSTAGHIFNRFLLGIPADIAWRGEAAIAAPKERTGQMTESWISRLGFWGGIALALFPVAFGFRIIVGGGDSDWDSIVERVIWGGLWIFTGAAIVAGLLLVRRTYGRGMALVAIGVIALCLSTFWMAFITLPVGIALLVLAHYHGRATPQSTGTA